MGRHHRHRPRWPRWIAAAVLAAAIVIGGDLAAARWQQPPPRPPAPAPAAAPLQTSRPARPPSPSPTRRPPATYTVRPGDTLTAIAGWFHIRDVAAFYRANRATVGEDWNLLRPGQVLRLTIGM